MTEKVVVSSQDFLESLKTVKPALDSMAVAEIFNCFCFDGDTVFVYSDKLAIRTKSHIGVDWAGAVNAKLLKAISYLAKKSETLELELCDRHFKVSAGQASYRFPIFPKSAFPFDSGFGVEGDDLTVELSEPIVSKMQFSAYSYDSKSNYVGSTFYFKEDEWFVASSSGSTLSCLRVTHKSPLSNIEESEIVFVVRPEFLRIISTAGSAGTLQLIPTDDGKTIKHVLFSCDKFDAFGACLKIEALNIPRILDSILNDIRFQPLPEDFWRSIKLACAVSATRFDPIGIGIHNCHITISTHTMSGEFIESMELPNESCDLDVSSNISSDYISKAEKLGLMSIGINDRVTAFEDVVEDHRFMFVISNQVVDDSDDQDDQKEDEGLEETETEY